MRRHRLLLPLLLCGLFLTLGARAVHAQAEIVSGTIRGPDKKPIEGAEVTVTFYDGSLSRQGRTDKNGLFRVVFADGSGALAGSTVAATVATSRNATKSNALATRTSSSPTRPFPASRPTPSTCRARHRARGSGPPRTDTSDIGGTTRSVSADALTLDQMGDLAMPWLRRCRA